MKNLFLHIGTHKTGTSAIQQALRSAGEKIKDLSYYWVEESYWLFKRFNPEDIQGVFSFIRSLKDIPQENLIFSSEGYTGGLLKNPYFVIQKAEILKKILTDFNVKVVLYLRRQDQFIESMYTQSVHQGNSYTFDEYLNTVINYKNLDWEKLIKIFSERFGEENMIVRPYDKNLFYKNDIIHDFFSFIGLKDLIQVNGSFLFNQSYSPRTLRIARHMNGILSTQREKDLLRTILQSLDTKAVFEKHCYLSPEKRMEIMSFFNESNQDISRKHFLQEDNIFALSEADLKLSVVDSSAISNEDIAAIMMKFFLSVYTSKPG